MNHHKHSSDIDCNSASLPRGQFLNSLPFLLFFMSICGFVGAWFYYKKNHDYFFFSFHVWWIFFVSIALGGLFFVLIQFATKAGWSVVVRRIAENTALTIVLFSFFAIVMYLGAHSIYHHWMGQESFTDEILNSKRWYLNNRFFFVRTFFYLVLFSAMAIFYSFYSRSQDINGSHAITYKLQKFSYPCLILGGFGITFAAFDWIMSLNPHWYSTIFGLYFFASCYVSFLAFLGVVCYFLRNNYKSFRAFNVEHFHDIGKLVFGHSCFWAYAAFAQYLLIWYGNIPEETMWYEVRQNHGWWPLWCLLCVGHFIVPFLFLMARKAKRAPIMVALVSVWMLAMHFIDLYWLIIPNYSMQGPVWGLLDLLIFMGLGGAFLATFILLMKRGVVLPIKDPRLPESLNYENV